MTTLTASIWILIIYSPTGAVEPYLAPEPYASQRECKDHGEQIIAKQFGGERGLVALCNTVTVKLKGKL